MRYITVFCRQIPRTRNDRQTALRASGDRNRCLRLFHCNLIITYLQSNCNRLFLFFVMYELLIIDIRIFASHIIDFSILHFSSSFFRFYGNGFGCVGNGNLRRFLLRSRCALTLLHLSDFLFHGRAEFRFSVFSV